MLARTGNMAEVYREFWRMQEIAEQVEPQMNRVVSNSTCTDAEIGEGASADWYLVTTFPGDDLKAMRHLARRRFGIFRPMQQKVDKWNPRVLQGWEPTFPGWLFVYVWDMAKLAARVRACPGVMGILADTVSLAPSPIPDHFVDYLHNLSWVYDERATRVAHEAHRHRKRRPRPGNRIRKSPDAVAARLCASEWANANRLAAEDRITLLKKTLASVDGSMSSGNGS